ncbi:MAG: hypothetical protein OXH84_00130 [Gammaproteobacteria bacterium]|nr:hypothetical protein [Gammaproteobacteria bacterium]
MKDTEPLRKEPYLTEFLKNTTYVVCILLGVIFGADLLIDLIRDSAFSDCYTVAESVIAPP